MAVIPLSIMSISFHVLQYNVILTQVLYGPLILYEWTTY